MAKPTFDALETTFTSWVTARAKLDPRYAEVLDIYRWAKDHHTGLRDNGEPEFIHPLRLALKVANLTDKMERSRGGYLPDALELIKAAICHDMLEDKNKDKITEAVMDRHFLARKIGPRAAQIVFKVSRKYIDDNGNFVRKTTEEDHNDIRSDAAALLLKHIDRNDNLETMVDFTKAGRPFNVVYTPEKQEEKLREANTVFLQASLEHRVRKNYGDQWVAPMNFIRNQLKLTYSCIMQRVLHFQIMRDIDAENTFGVRDLTRMARFPEKTVVREKDKPADLDGSQTNSPMSTFTKQAKRKSAPGSYLRLRANRPDSQQPG